MKKDKLMTRQKTSNNEATTIDAMVSYNNGGFQPHALTDLTLHKAFIKLKEPRLLKKSDPVSIALKLDANGETGFHLLRAKVSEVRHNGAEITFHELDFKTYGALLQLESHQNSIQPA
ncbi:MAG: hypothetical protein BMS9Abin11_0962 [Gammaproteobacteria bacterium]|nr:MAG: hypothetical protein BMS9Abin11_0962 [Gammaproteobacteria bacterium]